MPRRKTSLRMWLNQESTAGYFFAAPFIIGFVVFIVVPMLMSLYFSFCDYNILSPAKWIGFENFKNQQYASEPIDEHRLYAAFVYHHYVPVLAFLC